MCADNLILCCYSCARLPVVQAGTFALLVPTLSYLNLPEWQCPSDDAFKSGRSIEWFLSESVCLSHCACVHVCVCPECCKRSIWHIVIYLFEKVWQVATP